jgi:hypothetical protein
MSVPGQKDKFTPELRILVASLLSFGVKILWAEAASPASTSQSSSSDGSGNAGSDSVTGGELLSSGGTDHRSRKAGEHCDGKERFAGTHDRRREQSLPRGNFQPRRSGEKLAAQELQG